MISGETAFRVYFPLRLHYTTSYNIHESKGNFKGGSYKIYSKRSDRRLFESIARQFKTKQDMARFFIANFSYGNMYPISDISTAMERYYAWKKYKQGLTYYLQRDLDFILNIGCDKSEILYGNFPYAFFKAMTGEIYRETVLILDHYLDIITRWQNTSTLSIYERDLEILSNSIGLLIKSNNENTKKIILDFENYIK